MKRIFRFSAGIFVFAFAVFFFAALGAFPSAEAVSDGTSASAETEIRPDDSAALNALLDAYEAGTLAPRGMHTAFPHTPPVLLRCGMENLPIKISKTVLDKVTRDKHRVPVGELRRLTENLKNPIAVFRSRTRDGSFVVLTDIPDFSDSEVGLNAVVVLRLGAKDSGGKREINAIASVYGRRPENILSFFREERLPIYVNQKKARAYLQSNRLRLPAEASKRGKILTEKDFSKDDLGLGKDKK